MKNRNTIFTEIMLALACFGLLLEAQAVLPPPDGAYPGGNTAEGQQALFSLTTGTYNTAVGFLSLRNNTSSEFNTAIGAGTLLANTAVQNTATGAAALLNNTTGNSNTANGAFALFSNTTGGGNTATGVFALSANNTGGGNAANGAGALQSNTIGNFNTADGYGTLAGNTTGANNTAIGTHALLHNTSGSNNIALGTEAGINIRMASDTICIGIAGVDVTDGCYIGHVFEETIDPDNLPMAIDFQGKVGTMASSRRFKEDIRPVAKASEAILALKPVTFHYKGDTKCRPRFGLIAEDVAKVDPNLVARDKMGKPYSVRYDQVNAMLLNEFLKEHRKLEEQQATIAKLKSTVARQRKSFQSEFAKQEMQIETLASGLQKVSAQIEANKPRPQVALNDP